MPITTKKKIFFAFALPLIFWIYLAFSSQMVIVFDAIGFEANGKIFKSEGLEGYLKEGPQKEPLYAYSISLSMRLADILKVDYKKVQTCLQIFLLLIGQIILYRILLLLKINDTVMALALLYYGFSPALINSSLSLFSEVITLPLILLSVVLINQAWRFVLEGNIKSAATYAFLFSCIAIVAAFSKAVLLVLYPILILPFGIILIQSLIKKSKKQGQAALIFLIIFFIIFNVTVNGYKSLNKKYNGNSCFTDERGSTMLYTLAIKRTAPLTTDYLFMAFAMIPGENICRAFYGDACYNWLFDGSADLGMQKKDQLAGEGLPGEQVEKILISSAKKQVVSNPFQYFLFVSLESVRMFFWESTKIGFVAYPQWLTTLYDNIFVKNSLRLFVTLITLFSAIYSAIHLFKNRHKIYRQSDKCEKYQTLFFLFLFLILFTGLYGLVRIATRYALPIAPLFIALIAFSVHEKFVKNKPLKST